MSRLLLIDDDNAHQFTEDAVGDQYGFGLVPRDFEAEPFGASPFCGAFDISSFDRTTWDERLKDAIKSKSRPIDLIDFYGYTTKNQKRTNYCWMFSTIMLLEMGRIFQGQKHVPLSPASVAGPMTKYANARGNPAGVGGWTTKAVAALAKGGAVPSSIWPEHAIDPRYDTAEAKVERAKYQADEWYDLPPGDFSALATCLLTGRPVAIGLGWWGHLIVATALVKLDGSNRFGVEIMNPWGPDWPKPGAGGRAILTEEKATPNDAVCLRVVTAS